MAGVSRLQYTSDTRLIRVMCSGRVDPSFVFRAFANGVDGVFIAGCRLNECNYLTQGNYQALNMVLLCQQIMAYAGLNPNRLQIDFMSSGEGIHYVDVINEFGGKVEELGPLGMGEGMATEELKPKLDEVNRLLPYIKQVKKEKLRTRLASEDEYEGFYTRDEIEEMFREEVTYYIDPERCEACMICLRKCYVDGIAGGKNQIHVIDQTKCIKCGACFEVCPQKFGAVQVLTGEPAPPSIPEEERTLVRKKEKKQPAA
jgi:coenzyme F420-reducing hydrogenase delta subunit/Fe-S-cluster-containing hydrogenase component 2